MLPNAQIPRLVFIEPTLSSAASSLPLHRSDRGVVSGAPTDRSWTRVDSVASRTCEGAGTTKGRRTALSKRKPNGTKEGERVKRFGKKGLILVLGAGIAAMAISAAAVASSTKKSASIQVCVLLPDTKSSVRWTQ